MQRSGKAGCVKSTAYSLCKVSGADCICMRRDWAETGCALEHGKAPQAPDAAAQGTSL